MNYTKTAELFIRQPILDPMDYPGLTRVLAECAAQADWAVRGDACRQQQTARELSLPSPENYVMQGICCICEGAAAYAREMFQAAIDRFDRARGIFDFEEYEYGQAIALMGLAIAHHAHANVVGEATGEPSAGSRTSEADDGDAEERRQAAVAHYQLALKYCDEGCAILAKLRAKEELAHRSSGPRLAELCSRINGLRQKLQQVEVETLPIVPHYGDVSAGEPLYLPGEQYGVPPTAVIVNGKRYEFATVRDGTISRQRWIGTTRNDLYFAVTAKGDSMIGAGIRPGALLLVRAQNTAQNRDIAVFREPDSSPTVKRYVESPHYISLESANPRYPPRKYRVGNLPVILGIIVEILEESSD